MQGFWHISRKITEIVCVCVCLEDADTACYRTAHSAYRTDSHTGYSHNAEYMQVQMFYIHKEFVVYSDSACTLCILPKLQPQ